MLQAAVFPQQLHQLPGQELADVIRGGRDQSSHDGEDGKGDKLIDHLTASLYGPDEICTSAETRRSGTAVRPGRAEAPAGPRRRREYD